jgi:hypothetical protein
MSDPCTAWSRWTTQIEFSDAAGNRYREKLEAFLDPVLMVVERLAIACHGGRDVDIVAAFTEYLVRCDQVPAPKIDDLLAGIYAEAMFHADGAKVDAWAAVLDQVLAADTGRVLCRLCPARSCAVRESPQSARAVG